MNRNLYQAKEKGSLSRILRFGKLQGRSVGLALVLSICGTAIAQYPGGGGGTSTYPGGSPSYGSKGAVIGGVVAGAAVGAGLLYWKLHSRAKLQGCLSDGGDKLVTEKGNHTYNITNKQNQSLKPGERVELLGKKAKDASREPTFEVHKMSKDLGQCTATTAEQR
jgi:PAB1-binding protein PBP1